MRGSINLQFVTKLLIFRLLIVICLSITYAYQGYAQVTESQIKLSNEYYWGEGTAQTVDEARAFAKRDFATRIVTTIRSDSRMTSSELDGQLSQSFIQNVQSESNLQIRGLAYLDIRRRNSVQTIAYIKIEDYYRQVAEQTDKVRASVRGAMSIEGETGLDKALPEYLAAWMDARFIPTNVYITLDQDSLELNTLVRQKVRKWADGISIQATSVNGGLTNLTDVAIAVNIVAEYDSKSVESAEVRWAEAGYGFHKILSGEAKVFYDKLPTRIIERKRILITPSLTGMTESNQEIMNALAVEKSLEVNFREIIGVDIELLNNTESSLNLRALISNLSVSRMEWFVGNSSIGTTQDITIPINRLLSQPLSLVINRDTSLSVRRFWRNNQLIEMVETVENVRQQPVLIGGVRDNSDDVIIRTNFDFENDPLVRELVQIMDYHVLMNWLRSQTRVGNIDFGAVGQQDSVANHPNAYIVLVNPMRETLVAVLSKERNGFREIYGLNKRITDPAIEFQGQGVGPIWIQIK
jgi:hypothetical protein